MTIHCTNCGAAVTDSWKHCAHCGAATEAESIRQASKSVGAGVREGWQSAAPYSEEEIATQRELVESAHADLARTEESLKAEPFTMGVATGLFMIITVVVPFSMSLHARSEGVEKVTTGTGLAVIFLLGTITLLVNLIERTIVDSARSFAHEDNEASRKSENRGRNSVRHGKKSRRLRSRPSKNLQLTRSRFAS